MAKKKAPINERIAQRVKGRIESGDNLADISTYIISTARQFKNKANDIFASVHDINPLLSEQARLRYESLTTAANAKRMEQSQRNAQAEQEQTRNEAERINQLNKEYLDAKNRGDEIRWGVTLKPDDRKHFFSSNEIKQIVALRREKLSTYKVRQLLGCSLTEINRWDEEHLLPHAFKQVVQAGGKAVEARFWLESEVLAKKPYIESWRESHNLKKSFKRKKNPLSKVSG